MLRTTAHRLGVLLLSGTLVSGSLTSCTSAVPPVPGASTSRSSAAWPTDPMHDLRDDLEFRSFLAARSPNLHHRGMGATHLTIPAPPRDVVEVRFFVSCSPDADFRLTMGRFFAGPCGFHISNSGSIPIDTPGSPLDVYVEVPSGIRFWVVAFPLTENEIVQ